MVKRGQCEFGGWSQEGIRQNRYRIPKRRTSILHADLPTPPTLLIPLSLPCRNQTLQRANTLPSPSLPIRLFLIALRIRRNPLSHHLHTRHVRLVIPHRPSQIPLHIQRKAPRHSPHRRPTLLRPHLQLEQRKAKVEETSRKHHPPDRRHEESHGRRQRVYAHRGLVYQSWYPTS